MYNKEGRSDPAPSFLKSKSMIKVYICVSEISFNLKIGGNKRRINFDPICGGKSQYRTNEKEVQDGIENLEQFGDLISIDETIKEGGDENPMVLSNESEATATSVSDEDGAEGVDGLSDSAVNDDPVNEEKDVQNDIKSFAEAKEYLITKGCEKTIRSREHIIAYAKELGVEFPNLN